MELRPLALDPDGRHASAEDVVRLPRNRPPPARAFRPPAADRSLETARRKKVLLLLALSFIAALLGYATVTGTHDAIVTEEHRADIKSADQHNSSSSSSHSSSSSSSSSSIVAAKVEDTSLQQNHDGYQPTYKVNTTNYILSGINMHNVQPLSAVAGRAYTPITNHFQTKLDPSTAAHAASTKWGAFNFTDPDPKYRGTIRPRPININDVPNRDVSNADFPKGAWQCDAKYMTTFLRQAKLLINRTMEAIYAEYGVGIIPPNDDGDATTTTTDDVDGDRSLLSEEMLAGRDAFAPFILRDTMAVPLPPTGSYSYSTRQSFDGIARRVIHHIMTGDTFKLVLGGHSAAAGHGAGFNQSYIIEAGHVLEPIFAHLGVEFRAYNLAQGGMGTFQQSMAGMDLRGKETDWIVWDSSMTEKSGELSNFFYRQAILAGNRAPILMADSGYLSKGEPLTGFHDIAGASIVAYAAGGYIPETENDEQVKTMPWAAQWLKCSRTATTDCKAHEYTAGCWVEREDYSPKTPQDEFVGGQASWHPGNRIHKHRGRMLALVVLRSLKYAMEKWEKLGSESGYPIPEEQWHVTDYYNGIREKVTKVPGCFGNIWPIGKKRHLEELGKEEEVLATDFWPSRICDIPLQGRSLWGPRYNPVESSLLSIMKPNVFGDIDPTPMNTYMIGPIYFPPDKPAPWTIPPNDEEPFAPLIGAARRLKAITTHAQDTRKVITTRALDVVADNSTITPGLGLQVSWLTQGICDGTSHSWCDKTVESKCLMGGSQDSRGSVCFNGLSGWLVFDLKNVKRGFIGARMEAWRGVGDVPITNGWTEVNNGGRGNYDKRGRRLQETYQEEQRQEVYHRMRQEIERDIAAEDDPNRHRQLGGGQSCGAGEYTFEFAINGVITTWTKAQFCDQYTRLAYNLDVIKFMDDESLSGDKVELAMRLTPDSLRSTMCISHLYWA